MKYIIFKTLGGDLLHVVTFPESTTHSQITVAGAKAVSAGFWGIKDSQVKTYGRSESLDLDRNPLDQEIIFRCLNDMGTDAFIDHYNNYPKV